MDEYKRTVERDLPPDAEWFPLMIAVENWLKRELQTFGTGIYETEVIIEHDGGESRRKSVQEAREAAEEGAWYVQDTSLYAYERDPDDKLSFRDARRVVAWVRAGVINSHSPRLFVQIKGPVDREVRGFHALASQFADNLLSEAVTSSAAETAPAVAAVLSKDPAPESPRPAQEILSPPHRPPARGDRNGFLRAVSENPLAATIIGGLVVAVLIALATQIF